MDPRLLRVHTKQQFLAGMVPVLSYWVSDLWFWKAGLCPFFPSSPFLLRNDHSASESKQSTGQVWQDLSKGKYSLSIWVVMNNDLHSTFSSDFKAVVTEVVSKLIWNTEWQKWKHSKEIQFLPRTDCHCDHLGEAVFINYSISLLNTPYWLSVHHCSSTGKCGFYCCLQERQRVQICWASSETVPLQHHSTWHRCPGHCSLSAMTFPWAAVICLLSSCVWWRSELKTRLDEICLANLCTSPSVITQPLTLCPCWTEIYHPALRPGWWTWNKKHMNAGTQQPCHSWMEPSHCWAVSMVCIKGMTLPFPSSGDVCSFSKPNRDSSIHWKKKTFQKAKLHR